MVPKPEGSYSQNTLNLIKYGLNALSQSAHIAGKYYPNVNFVLVCGIYFFLHICLCFFDKNYKQHEINTLKIENNRG